MEKRPDLRLVHSGEPVDSPDEQEKPKRVLRVVRNTGIDFRYLQGLQHLDGNPFVKPPEPPDIVA